MITAMTQGEIINKLYTEISRQNSIYMTIIGIMITVIITISIAYVWQQLKFSNKGIKKLEKKFKKKFKKEFKIEKTNNQIFKINEASKKAERSLIDLRNAEDEIKKEIKSVENASFDIMIGIAVNALQTDTRNDFLSVFNDMVNISNILEKYEKSNLSKEYLQNAFIGINNSFDRIESTYMNDSSQKDFNDILEKVKNYLVDQTKKNISYKNTNIYDKFLKNVNKYLKEHRNS